MKERAIVFDFDGTLVQGGHDKGIHMMVAAWVACRECGFERFVHPEQLSADVDRLTAAILDHPGVPRFRQLAAMVNSLINNSSEPPPEPSGFGIDTALQVRYAAVRERYNDVYNAINGAAADRYWKPFPSVPVALKKLAASFDLYIASGITNDILLNDVDHHGLDRDLFLSIRGDDGSGSIDKGKILEDIKATGYKDVLFVGNANMDLTFALRAGVKFFRIRDDGDYARLLKSVEGPFPNEPDHWDFTPEDIAFFKTKTLYILERRAAENPMSPAEITEWIHS